MEFTHRRTLRTEGAMADGTNSRRFHWQSHGGGGLTLHLGHGGKALVEIRPDARYPVVYRIRVCGSSEWSDMVNLTRAKDAAFAIARRMIDASPAKTLQGTSPGAPKTRQGRVGAVGERVARKTLPRRSPRLSCPILARGVARFGGSRAAESAFC